ncbi:hypothetical protein [Kitasatospora sp. NPDC057223]|uniref:hypothetical protein n=1 Tax=Kitasatospora sp. NPDC057223 TaxID=3346055 RepID=UPI00362AA679
MGEVIAPLTVYYDAERLTCVVVNALRGPQVTLNGLPLVGRVPSALDDAFTEYASARGHGRRYYAYGELAWEELGVILRAQRAGDVVLSRPVFVGQARAESCSDASEGRIPEAEWHNRPW